MASSLLVTPGLQGTRLAIETSPSGRKNYPNAFQNVTVCHSRREVPSPISAVPRSGLPHNVWDSLRSGNTKSWAVQAYSKGDVNMFQSPLATESPYDILNLQRDATHEDVKTAYRQTVKTYHPDVWKKPYVDEEGSITIEEHFVKIQAAYELLSDPEKRKEYDMSHRQSPMAASEAWKEWIIKRKKAYEQATGTAVVSFNELNKLDKLMQRQRLRQKSADEERSALFKLRKEEKQKYDSISNRHALVLKRRDLKNRRTEPSAGDLAKRMLASEGFEIVDEDEDDDDEEEEDEDDMLLLLGDGSTDGETDPAKVAAKLLAKEGFQMGK